VEHRTLIARAPFRISFAGGGTDLPAYYEQYGGRVISTTIDRYVYAHITPVELDRASQITSADFQTFYRHMSADPVAKEGDLPLPRAVLNLFNVRGGLSLFLASEVPPGTGLGSSSATAVALIAGLSEQRGLPVDRHALASLACEVELDRLAAPIGKQDQYAAAFGGLNSIRFTSHRVDVERLAVSDDLTSQLERRLMLFFTGSARDSAAILRKQRAASERREPDTIQILHRIRQAADACYRCLEIGDLDGVARLLDEGWQQKRQLATGITNSFIDDAYATARAHGALGGKITGAGGGGFLLLYCEEERQTGVTAALKERGLRRMDFRFDHVGASVAPADWSRDWTSGVEVTGT
jgi:D-glycero-alpha-D-manno-heptose-7-phosphate kinase